MTEAVNSRKVVELYWVDIKDVLSQGWWGPVSVLVALALWLAPPRRSRLREYVDSTHPEDRKWLIDVLGGASAFEVYRSTIGSFNEKLASWFGTRWSLQAFMRCLQLAFIYPLTMMFITIAVSALSPNEFFAGLSFLCFLILGLLVGFLGGTTINRVQNHVAHWVTYRLILLTSISPRRSNVILQGTRIFLAVGGALGVGIATAIAFAGGLANASDITDPAFFHFVTFFAIAGILAGFLAFAAPIGSSFSIAMAVAFVSAITFAVVATYGAAHNFTDALALALTFCFVLPVLNAAIDWLSWGVTRFFLTKAAQAKSSRLGTALLFAELLADFLIAALLLIALAILLPFGVESLTRLLGLQSEERVDWTIFLGAFERDPWVNGFFVTGMLLTTLVPTFLHLVVGLAGVFFAWSPNAQAVAVTIPYESTLAKQKELSVAQKDLIVIQVRRVRLWIIPASGVIIILFVGLFALFSYSGETFMEFIIRAARCGGALAENGHC